MKKYRVTEQHEYLKEGLILSNYTDDPYYYSPRSNYGVHECTQTEITKLLESGWIEKIQEPEFTKSDMIIFGTQCYNKRPDFININNEFEKYLTHID